ncbi:hypothetical protein [Halopelagius longus]|uniref:Uncharacterized protein n=1 Tax=Halopelagius longus TaxID=1236180 RepID=A0A1H0XYS8_9EURY|nr:hypothetical protein [Halopelagius longus]RDI72178.1 hypothetical protein DWB78_10900 [Halopelagius longus]SDQ08043.1 hypothetical protein SAMN05216278_0288 [Halopelagius longus]
MLSRENAVILGFGALALGLAIFGSELPWWNQTLFLLVVIVVGILAPLAVNDYLDKRDRT